MALIKAKLVIREERDVEIEETDLMSIKEASNQTGRTMPAIAAMMDRDILKCYLVRDIGRANLRRMVLRSEVEALGKKRHYTKPSKKAK